MPVSSLSHCVVTLLILTKTIAAKLGAGFSD